MRRWLDRFFEREEINGHGICPTYLYRWTLLTARWPFVCSIYLHHFVNDDWSLDLHDHPKRFISIGLKGAYRESTPTPATSRDIAALMTGVTWRTFRAPWVRTFPADHIHRLELIDGRPCWTLVIVLKPVRPWGFWHNQEWIPWRTYVGSETAAQRKTCP
jgi:hypothetical protein